MRSITKILACLLVVVSTVVFILNRQNATKEFKELNNRQSATKEFKEINKKSNDTKLQIAKNQEKLMLLQEQVLEKQNEIETVKNNAVPDSSSDSELERKLDNAISKQKKELEEIGQQILKLKSKPYEYLQEMEKEQLAQIKMEKKRLAQEMEKQRLAQIKMEKQRLAQVENERSSDYFFPLTPKDLPKLQEIRLQPEQQKIVQNRGVANLNVNVAQRNESTPFTEMNTENYSLIVENDYKDPRKEPLSTFSIDVDTASYSNIRRYLNSSQLPPKDSVRIEEMINYFSYDYPQPKDRTPFAHMMEVAECPWNPDHWLVHIGIQGFSTPMDDLPPTNLVFLLDVSGSMRSNEKLPLLKTAMGLLTEQLRPNDKVAIVVYAGAAGVVLPSTSGKDKDIIMNSLSRLQAGGSTNGEQGIELAYQIAQQNYVPGGVNRVILATDGDFNVGVSSHGDLIRMIEEKRKTGVFLTVLGLGIGNLKDSTMEQLADKGNGNYAYLDTLSEAKKVLVNEVGSTLLTIAKDVKIQVEFNPNFVGSYRLVGYENRVLQAQDFNDDTKDAGEIGSGHSVTALYEIVPFGKHNFSKPIDPLKYQEEKNTMETEYSNEILTLKIRYKEPNEDTSKLLSSVLTLPITTANNSSRNFRFSAAVATLGLLLRDSKYKSNASMRLARYLAIRGKGNDPDGYRREFIELIDIADALMKMK